MKTALTTVTYFDDIHTLKQLDERDLRIGTSSGSLKKVFGTMDNVFGDRNCSSSIIKSLKSKYILLNTTAPALDKVVYDGNICCIERYFDSKLRLSVRKLYLKFSNILCLKCTVFHTKKKLVFNFF